MVSHGTKRKGLIKLGQALMFYIGFRIRRCITDKHRGEDPPLDDSIKYVAAKQIFETVHEKETLPNLDERIVSKITDSIDEATRQDIDAALGVAQEFLPALRSMAQDKEPDYGRIRLLRSLRLAQRIRRAGKTHYRHFKYLHTVKSDFSAESVGKFLALLTPMLLLGGILRQLILSASFGFSAGDVFNIGDYVSSSITTLAYALAPLLVMIVLGSLAHVADTGQDPITASIEAKKGRRDSRIFYLALLVLSIAIVAIDRRALLLIIPYFVVISLFQVLPSLLRRYFKKPLELYVMAAFSLLFVANIITNTLDEVDKIKNPETKSRYSVQFGKQLNFQTADLRYVTSGSKYSVFYNVSTKKTVLVRPDSIEMMTVSTR